MRPDSPVGIGMEVSWASDRDVPLVRHGPHVTDVVDSEQFAVALMVRPQWIVAPTQNCLSATLKPSRHCVAPAT